MNKTDALGGIAVFLLVSLWVGCSDGTGVGGDRLIPTDERNFGMVVKVEESNIHLIHPSYPPYQSIPFVQTDDRAAPIKLGDEPAFSDVVVTLNDGSHHAVIREFLKDGQKVSLPRSFVKTSRARRTTLARAEFVDEAQKPFPEVEAVENVEVLIVQTGSAAIKSLVGGAKPVDIMRLDDENVVLLPVARFTRTGE